MGFYSCVAKSSAGEATWSGWLRRRGEFLFPCFASTFLQPYFKGSQYLPKSQHWFYFSNAVALVVGTRRTAVVPLGGRCE